MVAPLPTSSLVCTCISYPPRAVQKVQRTEANLIQLSHCDQWLIASNIKGKGGWQTPPFFPFTLLASTHTVSHAVPFADNNLGPTAHQRVPGECRQLAIAIKQPNSNLKSKNLHSVGRTTKGLVNLITKATLCIKDHSEPHKRHSRT